MGFIVSTPSYMYQSPSGYIFRLRIPKDLKHVVGKSEFRYSLRAGAIRVARQRARAIASFIQQLFIKVRSSMSEFTSEKVTKLVKEHVHKVAGEEMADKFTGDTEPGSIVINGEEVLTASYNTDCDGSQSLSPERIAQLVATYIQNTLSNDERCKAITGAATGTASLPGMSILEGSNMGTEEARSILSSVKRWLKLCDYSLLHPLTEKLLLSEGVSANPKSETYKILSRELLVAFHGILRVRIARSEGDYSVPDDELIPRLKQQQTVIHEAPVVAPKPAEPVVKFTEVQERYVTEKEKGGSWTGKTKSEYLKTYELFVEIMGDLDVAKIDRKIMSEFKDTLLAMPPNHRKNRKYRNLSIPEILALKPEKTLAPKTINILVQRIGSVLDYAVKRGDMLANPALGLKIPIKTRPSEQKAEYTKGDLAKLFSSEVYTERGHKYPCRFWAPLIGVYSGCRIEEICQLHLEDIRQESNVWIFDINAKGEKKLKNMASARLVPIHPQLIELGLLNFVNTLKEARETRLFPELNNRQHGKYSHHVSRWFSDYKEKCGIEKGKTFHSLRHTFITHLKYKEINETMMKEVAGHTVSGETFGRYGKRYPVDLLFSEVIEKVDYEIDSSLPTWPEK